MYKFCNGILIKLLRKGIYPYEYMDSWEIIHETPLLPKKDFCNELNLEDISDRDYEHAQKVFNEYCTNMGKYNDLHFQTDTFLLADIFEKFMNKCIEKYVLDPSHFLSAPGLAWQACFKKNKNEFVIINRYWYFINDRNRN